MSIQVSITGKTTLDDRPARGDEVVVAVRVRVKKVGEDETENKGAFDFATLKMLDMTVLTGKLEAECLKKIEKATDTRNSKAIQAGLADSEE